MSRRSIASFHESAHAVVRVVLQLVFERIAVYDDPTLFGVAGHMIVLSNFPLYSTEHRHAAIVSALASIPAELWLDKAYECRPRKRQPRSHHGLGKMLALGVTVCKDDFDGANKMAHQFGESMQEALDEAFALVYDNWDAIVRVAEALNTAGALNYDEVCDLCFPDMQTAGGDSCPEEFNAGLPALEHQDFVGD